ncbi:MAG TPA: glycosyltransferase family 2 protein [Gammaproteobacteria bacterium]|nr:glycosyltransferase family 2 protein [Gammaproteobacteria bacterium]
MAEPKVSVLIPNYRTPELTKLCLELLKKHTDLSQVHVIAIDNHSEDASVEYLRQVPWITLIERKADAPETPPQSHARALDLALSQVTTPYVLSIHTDTLIKHPQWLNYLLGKIEKNPNIAGVGSWKLESKPFHKRLLKTLERKVQMVYYKIINKENHALEGVGKNYFYLRSHCALYRTELLNKYRLKFDESNEPAGKIMHKKLVDAGHDMIFLHSRELGHYLDHINHATMILNPELGVRPRTVRQGLKKIQALLEG